MLCKQKPLFYGIRKSHKFSEKDAPTFPFNYITDKMLIDPQPFEISCNFVSKKCLLNEKQFEEKTGVRLRAFRETLWKAMVIEI